MKKIFFLLVALTATWCASAQNIDVTLYNGQHLYGTLTDVSDTVLTIVNDHALKLTVPISKVAFVDLSGKDKIVIQDDKFVLITKEQFRQDQYLKETSRAIGDPNYAVGKALKSAGKTSLSLGIPSLLVGTILLAYGQSGKNVETPDIPKQSDYKNTQAYLEAMQQYSSEVAKITAKANENSQKKQNCTIAGCVLMPFGAALTVVGIPLTVKGKQLMELKVNYTGNGAGLALAW